MRSLIAFLLCFLLLGQSPSYAFFPVDGNFTVNSCFAYTSIKKKSNPLGLEPGKVYPASGLNKEDGDYISIKVNGQDKWVNKNCGQLSLRGEETDDNRSDNGEILSESCPVQGCAKEYVLAISWQPSFCQTHQDKKECKTQTTDRYDAANFTLHGLWPEQLSYCGVSAEDIEDDKAKNWDELSPISVDQQTRAELEQIMPGIQSNLDRHEWIKHGTCDGRNEDTYYDISLDLVKQINASELQSLFAQNIGNRVTRSQIALAFNNSFGENAAKSLEVECKEGLITELQIKMQRPILGAKLRDILIPTTQPSCNQGLIDPVGF